MREVCSQCSHDPSCATQEEMQARHGTPKEFHAAVMRALGEFISWQEAQAAIRQYERDFARAPKG